MPREVAAYHMTHGSVPQECATMSKQVAGQETNQIQRSTMDMVNTSPCTQQRSWAVTGFFAPKAWPALPADINA